MAAAFVQATNGSNGSSPFSTTFTTSAFAASTTSGNAILVAITYDASAGGTFTSVTDSKGNTYTAVGAVFVDANTNSCRHFYNLNIVGGASHTITVNAGGVGFQFLRVVAHEVSGLLTSAALDKDSGGNSVTATSGSATSVTPTTDGQYIFASGLNAGGTATDTLSPGSGFTEPANSTGGPAANELMCEYQVQTTATAVAAGFTRPSSGLMTMRTSTFKASSVAPAALVPPLTVPVSQVVGKFKPWLRQQLWNFDYPAQGPTNYPLPADLGTLTLSGQPVGLRATRVTAAGLGTLTLAGQNVGLAHGYKMPAGLGTLTLSGQPVTLKRTYVMPAGLGTLTLSGQTVALKRSYVMPAGLGTLTLSGQTVIDRYSHKMPGGLGTLTLAGQPVALRATRTATAGLGTLTLSGQVAVTRYGHNAVAGLGTLTLSGQTATLKRSYVMPAGLGTLTLSGAAVNLIYSGAGAKTLPAGLGVITLSGQPVALRVARRTAAGLGTLTLSGQPIGLRATHIPLTAGLGTLTLSGQIVTTRFNHRTAAGLGTLTLSGQPAALKRTYVMKAGLGVLTLAGPTVNLIYSNAGHFAIPAGLGVIGLSGQPVTLRRARNMPAGLGTLTLSGQIATLRTVRRVAITPSIIVLSGQDAVLNYHARQAYVLTAGSGILALRGNTASLVQKSQPGILNFGRRVTIPNRW
jgi:hypothetical protein